MSVRASTACADSRQGALHPPARVRNFPDPSLVAGGQGVSYTLPSGWDIQAPEVIKARKACARVGIAIPGTGVAWFGPLG
jgi:hypothetical protein